MQRYVIEPERKLVRLQYAAPPSFEEWRECLHRVIADPAFQRGYSFLDDHRLHGPVPADEEVRRGIDVVRELAPKLSPCRWAVVFSPGYLSAFDQVRAGAGRLREEEVEVHVFLDYDAALRWATGGA